MLRESLRVAVRTDDFVGTCLTGGFLLALSVGFIGVFGVLLASTPLALLTIPIALLPTFLLRGYYVRVIRNSIGQPETLPSFIRWGELYRDGVKSGLLVIGYVLPLVGILGGIVVGILITEPSAATEASPTDVSGVVSVAGSLLGGVYLLAVLYVQPAAVACFATTGRLRDGFALRRVLSRVTTRRYLTGWLLATAVTIAGLAVSVPLVAILIGIPLVFYSRVVAHWLYGRATPIRLGGAGEDTYDSHTSPETGTRASSQGGSLNGGTVATDDAATLKPTRDSHTTVQTGRDVPLTASDIRSTATSGEHDHRHSTNSADRPEGGSARPSSLEDNTRDEPDSQPRFKSLPATDPDPNLVTTSTHDLSGERLPVNHRDTAADDFEWGARPDDDSDEIPTDSTDETPNDASSASFEWWNGSQATDSRRQHSPGVEEGGSTTEDRTETGGANTEAER